MIKLVYAGGQSGSDVSGWRAAKACGIPTEGYMTADFRTLDGPRPEYAELYRAKSCGSNNYKDRTWLNVKESDGTIRFATVWNSPGEKCTWNAIQHYDKPYFNVDLNNPYYELYIEEVAEWIKENDIQVLNVAGNSEKTSRGIEKKVYEFLVRLFGKINDRPR